ncbi:MAG: NUDIX domain-containing protein [Patescibacteria group bacterium]
MNLISEIRQKDIDPSWEQLPDEAHINYRESAKAVLFDQDDNIALVYYPPIEGFFGGYYLPGGGLEEGETILETFYRETLEETGCKIKEIGEIGFIIEYMKDKLLKQKVFAFTARVDGEKGECQPTESEKKRGMEIKWKPLGEAIKLVEANQYIDFAKFRAIMILGLI